MDASQLLGTIIRILNQPVFPPRAKPAHAGEARPANGRPHVSAAAARPSLSTGPTPITVKAPPLATPAPSPATTQAMRTLEQVRADLAHLREQARRRQAATAQARRERAFAPTDFMEYGLPAAQVSATASAVASAPAAARAFAPTDFMDIGTKKAS